MQSILMDLRYGLRALRMNAGSTSVAVFILAVGIAANTTIFSIVNALVFRPLPYADADRLVSLSEGNESLKSWGGVSYPDFMDWQAGNQVLDQMALIMPDGANISIGEEPERVPAVRASRELVPMLGARLAVGRSFAQQEYQPGAPRAVLISNGFWKRRFGANPEIAGRALKIGGEPHIIIGVLGADFRLADIAGFEPDIWMPLAAGAEISRGSRSYAAIGKLKPGVPIDRAQADLNILARRLEERYPATNAGWKVMVSALRGGVDPVAYALLAVLVLSVLGIVCTNVVSLRLAQNAAREKELAVRAALGANRSRLGRQLFSEGLLLASTAAGLGVLASFWACGLIRASSEGTNLALMDLGPDARVLAATVVLFLATTLAVALLPAVRLSSVDLSRCQRAGANTPAGSSRGRLRTALIAAEVTLSFTLMVGAGLVVKSWTRLWQVDMGYRAANVLTMRLWLPGNRYPEARQQSAFFEAVLDRLGRRGEIRSAGVVSSLPTWGQQVPFAIPGLSRSRQGEECLARFFTASPGFFGALSIEPKAGRFFTAADSANSPPAAVVNQCLARRYWDDRNPVGEQIEVAGKSRTIIGIAGDMRSVPFHKTPMPEIWVPFVQAPSGTMILAVQTTSGDPLAMAQALKKEIIAIDPEQAVDRIRTMEQVLMQDMGVIRAGTRLLATFAAGAILLAAVGIYALLSHSVTRRTAEFGIRMALGARRIDVLGQVLKEGLVLTLLGLVPGIAASLVLGKALSASLYGVRPLEPVILSGLALLLLSVVLLACYMPARHATRVDPSTALRGE